MCFVAEDLRCNNQKTTKTNYPLIMLKRTAAASAWAVVGDGEGDTVLLGEVLVLTCSAWTLFTWTFFFFFFFDACLLLLLRAKSFSLLMESFWL